MECPRCRHPLVPQQKFCSECGLPVSGQGAAAELEGAGNGNASRLAKALADYGRFVRMSLTAPAAFSAGLGARESRHGWITALLSCLFMANLFYYTAGNAFAAFLGLFDFAPYRYGFRYGFVHFYVRPFVWLAVLHGITAGAVYAASRMMKAGLKFRDILARYGSLLAVPAALFGIASFLALIGVYRLAGIASMLGIAAWLAAAGYTVYGCGGGAERGGLDRLHGALAAFAIVGLAVYLLVNLLF